MFPGISAAVPILSIFGIAVAVQVVKMGLRVFNSSQYEHSVDTLGIILVSTMVLVASLSFASKIVAVFK